MTDAPTIDDAIERLQAALEEAGLDPLQPASADDDVLDEIAATISPYALPADLARFWGVVRVEEDAFPVSGWRMGFPSSPAAALEAYRLSLEPGFAGLFGPPLLFPIARHAETQWSIELRSEWAAGGVVISHDDDMQVEYPSFADLVDVYAELVEEGAYVPGARPALLADEERRRRQPRLDDPRLRSTYGGSLRIGSDPSGWPAHWLASAGIELSGRAPLGATHTVAEILSASATQPVTGRIRGEIVELAGTGSDRLVVVDDGTGRLGVWCPAGTSPWGPFHRQHVELEVTVSPTSRAAGAGESGPAEAVAVASDLRPID